MRVGHRYLNWNSHPKIIKPIRAILDRYNISYKYKEDLDCVIPSFRYSIEFYLYEDNPIFDNVKKEVDSYGIEPQTASIYEKKDIERAEWFIISTGEFQYPQPEDSYREATFNLENYCKFCGMGKVQNNPFRLNSEPKQHNHQFWGLHWEFDAIFVRQETKDILEREKIKGIKFSQPVLNKKSIKIEGLFQLHIENLLSAGFDVYNTKTITCKANNEENCNADINQDYCGRIKFHHPLIGGYLFDQSIFNSTFDIAESREYFGSGGSAFRLQIVSKKIKQLVEKNKLKGISFKPVMHERFKR